MLHTLFVLWAFAVAIPATALAVVVAVQGAVTQVRRLFRNARSTTARAPAGA